jgi:Domain of unknown function (DUF5753)/Helix-turn-helix domain
VTSRTTLVVSLFAAAGREGRPAAAGLAGEPEMSTAEIGEGAGAGARPGSAVARIMLGGQLRRHREAAGIAPDEAGYHIRASRAKISRLETGRARCKERDVLDLLALYGVDDAEVVAGLLVLVSQARTQDWWVGFSDVLPAWFEPYLGMENSASVIRAFDLQFACGLFQTEDYARAVTVLGHRDARAGEIERRVAVRMKRQELLADADPPKVWAVLDEAALRRPVGGTPVMRGQVRRLLEAAEMPTISTSFLVRGTLLDGPVRCRAGVGACENQTRVTRFALAVTDRLRRAEVRARTGIRTEFPLPADELSCAHGC